MEERMVEGKRPKRSGRRSSRAAEMWWGGRVSSSLKEQRVDSSCRVGGRERDLSTE